MKSPRLCHALLCTCFVAALNLGARVENVRKARPDITIERLDPALDALLPAGTKVEQLADGFEWSEGPVWMPEAGGYLLFSDVPANRVYRWNEAEGVTVFLQPSGYTGGDPTRIQRGMMGANGLARAADGSLLLCQHGDRRIARLTPAGAFVTVAGRWNGEPLNSPNDLAVAPDGAVWFTDPPFGHRGGLKAPGLTLGFSGIYRVTPGGMVTPATRDVPAPNGLGFSPDGRRLYVGNHQRTHACWFVFDVTPDGTLANQREFFDATPLVAQQDFAPDGLKVDPAGNLWACGPTGVLILSPRGRHLGTIRTGVKTANCAFGGADGRTLFITADRYLLRVEVGAAVVGPPIH